MLDNIQDTLSSMDSVVKMGSAGRRWSTEIDFAISSNLIAFSERHFQGNISRMFCLGKLGKWSPNTSVSWILFRTYFLNTPLSSEKVLSEKRHSTEGLTFVLQILSPKCPDRTALEMDSKTSTLCAADLAMSSRARPEPPVSDRGGLWPTENSRHAHCCRQTRLLCVVKGITQGEAPQHHGPAWSRMVPGPTMFHVHVSVHLRNISCPLGNWTNQWPK